MNDTNTITHVSNVQPKDAQLATVVNVILQSMRSLKKGFRERHVSAFEKKSMKNIEKRNIYHKQKKKQELGPDKGTGTCIVLLRMPRMLNPFKSAT